MLTHSALGSGHRWTCLSAATGQRRGSIPLAKEMAEIRRSSPC